jgi:galactonate dehydratase
MPTNTQLRRERLSAAIQAAGNTAPASRSGLEIADVTAWTLREPVSKRTYTVVRLRTKSGIAGYGECVPVAAAEMAAAKQAITGKPVTSFEVMAPLLAQFPTARAALNVAMLDAAGKAINVPIYQVLGGPTRGKARALTPLSGDSDPALINSLKRALAAGYRAFVVPAPETTNRNQGQAYVQATRKRLETLRQAAGDGSDFVLDGGNRLTPGDAQMVSADIETFHVLWFNEPCPATNLGALRKIAGENVTPIGLGRHAREGSEIQDLLREDAVDIVRPDLGLNGISQVRRMAAIAETYYVAVGPTHEGGPVGTAAALQLAASIPNFFIQQIPFPEAEQDRRMRSELAGASLEAPRDGFFDLPAGPGLGITVNEQALDKYKEAAA